MQKADGNLTALKACSDSSADNAGPATTRHKPVIHRFNTPEKETAIDIIRWCLAVAGLPADSPRFNYYVSRWDVPAKIARAKEDGSFESAIAQCPPINPAWISLVPAAIAEWLNFTHPNGKAESSGMQPMPFKALACST